MGTLVVALVAGMLAGCSSLSNIKPRDLPNVYTKSQPCNGEACDLLVTVLNCEEGRMDVANLDMRHNSNNERTITWTLSEESDKNYEFSKESFKDGLFIKYEDGNQFKGATNAGKKITIKFTKDAQSTGHYIYYALTVRQKNEPKRLCRTLDPWMIS